MSCRQTQLLVTRLPNCSVVQRHGHEESAEFAVIDLVLTVYLRMMVSGNVEFVSETYRPYAHQPIQIIQTPPRSQFSSTLHALQPC
jgi:hypothetical protein